MLQTKSEIETWLKNIGISAFSINEDLVVDVFDDVDISNKNLHEIPVQFGIISGNFICNGNNFDSPNPPPLSVLKSLVI